MVIQEESRFLKQAEISATAILPHIWTPFSPFIFSFLSQAPWQVSSLFLVLQLLPHSTWTAEPSHKISIMNNVHHLLRCICFSPSRACNMTGEAQALTEEQIPRCHGGQAQQRTLAAFSNTAACFSTFGALSPSNWPWRTRPHLRNKAGKEPSAMEMANTAKRYAPLLGPPQKCYSSHHPMLIAISRYGGQGTEGGRWDISNLGCL